MTGRPSAPRRDSFEAQSFSLEPPRPRQPPFDAIVDVFHECCPDLRRVRVLSDARKVHLRRRWANELDTLDKWRRYFERVHESDFLCGRVKPWKASFDWLLKPSSIIKVYEGEYDNE